MSTEHVHNIIKVFKDTPYPLQQPPIVDVLTAYDGDFFSDWDYEVLGSKVRKYMRERLVSEGYEAEGSRFFYEPSRNWRFFIPKPMNTLGGDIVSGLEAQNEAQTGTMLVNPTEGILMLLSLEKYQDLHLRSADLQNFVRTHPINIPKIVKMKKDTPNYNVFLAARDAISKAQKEGIQARKVANFKRRSS